MPSSSAKRMKKFIEQLKLNGLYDDYKEKRNEASKRHRQKTKEKTEILPIRMCLKTLDEARQKTRERVQKCRLNKNVVKKVAKKKRNVLEETRNRVRKCRENKKANAFKNQLKNLAYNTDASLRKAVSRVRAALPKNEEKSKAVLMKLSQQYMPSEISTNKKKVVSRPNSGLCPKIKEAVISFYDQVDISSQAPGRKDFVTVLDEDGKKTQVQTKYLMYPIREVYAKFCKEYCLKHFFSEKPKV